MSKQSLSVQGNIFYRDQPDRVVSAPELLHLENIMGLFPELKDLRSDLMLDALGVNDLTVRPSCWPCRPAV